MRFWDASAIIPLLIGEFLRDRAIALLKEDEEMLAWWGTPVEIASALARRERERALTADEASAALSVVKELSDGWHEIVPTPAVRLTAQRMLRMHPLRAADSLQLAAALIAADHAPASLEFVCFDERLASAAAREGFAVIAR
jgi:predicted nucleic acid-binding protein